MANLFHHSSKQTNRVSYASGRRRIIRLLALLCLILLAAAAVFYYFKKETVPENVHGVYARPDGSVPQVEAYIKQNFLSDSGSFTPVHWSKLQVKPAFGDTTYQVGVIYKGRKAGNEVLMDSKVFELNGEGHVVFVMDVPPMNNK